MEVIGLTGGIGAGKTLLMSLLDRQNQLATICADNVGRNLMEKNGPTYKDILLFFGDDILDADKEINREKLAKIVFKEKNKLAVLNSIVHPAVKNAILEDMHKKESLGYKYYFIEAAILLEAHYEPFCDQIWYLYASEYVRKERLIKSRGYSLEDIEKILESQKSFEEIKESYLKEKIKFAIEELNDFDFLSHYKGDLPWTVINNDNNQITSKAFEKALPLLLQQ